MELSNPEVTVSNNMIISPRVWEDTRSWPDGRPLDLCLDKAASLDRETCVEVTGTGIC